MSFKHILTVFLVLLGTVTAALGQRWYHAAAEKFGAHKTSKTAFTPLLKEFIQDVRHDWNIPGLSIAVVHAGSNGELEGFGDSTEEGAEVSAHTLFNIASCSKAFLAGSLGILMDDFAHNRNVTSLPEGLRSFDWYTRVRDILPNDWAIEDEWAHKKATIRDLLTHVSGLPGHDLSFTPLDSPVDVIRRMRFLRPSFELRGKFQYNNQMYVLATHVISLYSGMSYIDFITERIFAPLNMTSTTFSELEALETGLLSHAFNAEGRRVPFWFSDSIKDLTSGPGGIISNAHDMAKWVRMLLHKGVDYTSNKTILSSFAFEAMTSAYTIVSPAPYPEFSTINYALGWNIFSYQGHEILQHHGAIPGYSTQVAFLPHDNIGVVIICNASQKEKQVEAILYRIVESLLGLPNLASSRLVASRTDHRHHGSERFYDDQRNLQVPELLLHNTDETNSFPLNKYLGTYMNLGYPKITICHPSQLVSESPVNKICTDTLKDFRFFDDFSRSNNTLYLAITNLWVRQARLHPIDSHHFKVTSTHLFPKGYGRDRSPFEMSEMAGAMGDIEFAVSRDGRIVGFGMKNSDVPEVTERQRKGGGVRDTAGVVFDKI